MVPAGETVKWDICNMRGYSIIALDNPKHAVNVGSVLRAAYCYGVNSVVMSGKRFTDMRHCTDTMKAWRHLPVVECDDVMHQIPYSCVPVAVEFIESGIPLPQFQHPERAYYIFGAEDNTLGKRVLNKCAHVVYVPTNWCMNLAATVNVVLYDRMCKGKLQ